MATITVLGPGDLQPAILTSTATPQQSTPMGAIGLASTAARSDHTHPDQNIRDLISAGDAANLAAINGKSRNVEFEIDFGAGALFKQIVITGFADLTVNKPIAIFQSGNVVFGRPADESEMEMFHCVGRCMANGELTVLAKSLEGKVAGIYKFIANY